MRLGIRFWTKEEFREFWEVLLNLPLIGKLIAAGLIGHLLVALVRAAMP